MTNAIAMLTTFLNDNAVELIWEVPYVWSKPVPATRLDPPEGGLELDGDARCVKIIIHHEDGTHTEVPPCKDEKWFYDVIPHACGVSEEMMWEAAASHQNGEYEYGQELLAERREAARRGD